MKIIELSTEEKIKRNKLGKNIEKLQNSNICPTCKNFQDRFVFPEQTDKILFENDSFLILLEQYPRSLGHTIIIVKPHYEDISHLPENMIKEVYTLIHMCIKTLKTVLNAEKVYLCTMCDGKRNHLHYQLIPRYKGQSIGSKNFVKTRCLIVDYEEKVKSIKKELKNQLLNFS